MDELELKIGDLLFFVNHYKGENPYEYVDHVALFAGFNKETGHPEIIHSITSEKGHYHPEKASGLCRTTLRALKNQLQREEGYPDIYYDVEYQVVRFKNAALAQEAFNILDDQSRYRIPYDEPRLAAKIKLEDEECYSAEDFCQNAEKAYKSTGIYRSIKYASRLPRPLVRTRKDGVGRGLTCSMAVVLAYQAAELIKEDAVRPSRQWVSDKYARLPEVAAYPDAYMQYLAALQPSTEKREDGRAELSYARWDPSFDKTPEEYEHQSFAVDCKTIGAAGIFYYVTKNSEHWEMLGKLNVQERVFSIEDKLRHKAGLEAQFMGSLDAWDKQASGSASLVSERLSPSPYLSGSFYESNSEGVQQPWFAFFLKPNKASETGAAEYHPTAVKSTPANCAAHGEGGS